MSTVKDRFRAFIYKLATGWSSSQGHRRKKLSPSTVKRVVIFRYDAIGDYIVTTPLITWLKQNVPNVQIDIIGSTRNKSLIELDPNIDRALYIEAVHGPRSSWLEVRRFLSEQKYDIVFATVVERMTKAVILSLFTGRKTRRVSIEHVKRKDTYAEAFDFQVKHDQPMRHWFSTFEEAGPTVIDALQSALPKAYVPISEHARAAIADLTQQPYIVVNISTHQDVKRWNSVTAVPALKQIIQNIPQVHVFVIGSPADSNRATEIVTQVDSPRCTTVSRSLPEVCALIESARLVLTPDTAIVHIASALGVPVVGLYLEAKSVVEWGPYNVPNKTLVSSSIRSIDSITSADIAQATTDLMNELTRVTQ